MKKTETVLLLEQLILLKKAEQVAEGILLKEHFYKTYESLKPLSIIKNVFKEVISAPDLKTTIVKGAMDLLTNFVVRKVGNTNKSQEE